MLELKKRVNVCIKNNNKSFFKYIKYFGQLLLQISLYISYVLLFHALMVCETCKLKLQYHAKVDRK